MSSYEKRTIPMTEDEARDLDYFMATLRRMLHDTQFRDDIGQFGLRRAEAMRQEAESKELQ